MSNVATNSFAGAAAPGRLLSRPPEPQAGNQLLRCLSKDDLAALNPRLARCEFASGQVLESPETPIDAVLFLDAGLVSVIARGPGGRRIEAGLIGCEGMTGLAVMMGGGLAMHECRAQIAGRGRRIQAADLLDAFDARPSLRRTLLRYVQAFLVQIAHTALVNSFASLEERLARWLLMAHDRLTKEGGIPLTHDRLSTILGVRRPTVTDAIHRLEGEGVIRARRGLIHVRDRARLEAAAGGFYGEPERAYQRLIDLSARTPPRDGPATVKQAAVH